MHSEFAPGQFPRLWRRLQQLGLNAYEARSYLVLLGHPRFKALEVAARAHVPRQKIYEVLDSLVEKGFAQVVQEKTKLFSAVDPELALPGYVERSRRRTEEELARQAQAAAQLAGELRGMLPEGSRRSGVLDYLQIISEPSQSAAQYRRMLAEARSEYLEFSRPSYAVDVIDEELVRAAVRRGVACRVLLDPSTLDEAWTCRIKALAGEGLEARRAVRLPLKMALFDGCRGLIALLDPVVTRPAWTALMFDHPGLGEAMRGLFEQYWSRSEKF